MYYNERGKKYKHTKPMLLLTLNTTKLALRELNSLKN